MNTVSIDIIKNNSQFEEINTYQIYGKSRHPLQFKAFHTILGLCVFFSLITIPTECQIISMLNFEISAQFLWWPIICFLLAIIERTYGFEYLRQSVYLIILFRSIYILFLKIAIIIPSSSFWKLQDAYSNVLGRDFNYIINSSITIWVCFLVIPRIKLLFMGTKKIDGKYIYLFFSFSLALYCCIFIQKYSLSAEIYENNLIFSSLFFVFLYFIYFFFSKTISSIENINPLQKNMDLLKFKTSIQNDQDKIIFKYHHILFCINIVFFIASKTMASKFISIGFFTINVGGLVFSLSYLTADIMTDAYGIERTKQMIYFVLLINLIFVFNIWITKFLSLDQNSDYCHILNNQFRLFFASAPSYFLGMTLNSSVISILKNKQRKRGISLKKEFLTTVWIRIATSSAFGIFFDVSLFSFSAFYDVVPNDKLMSIIFFEDIYKISYEIILAPISVLLIYLIKTKEKIDIYDNFSNLNPFKLNTNYNFDANKFHDNFTEAKGKK